MKYFLFLIFCCVMVGCSTQPVVLGGVVVSSNRVRHSDVSIKYLGFYDDSTKIYPFKKDSCYYFPKVKTEVLSVYPEIAVRAGVEGVVKVKLHVDSSGVVRRSIVVESNGEVFNQPAIDAAMQYIFDCYEINCKKKPFTVELEFIYTLEGYTQY